MTPNQLRHLAPLALLASLSACTSSGAAADGVNAAGDRTTADVVGSRPVDAPGEAPAPPINAPGAPAADRPDQDRAADGAPIDAGVVSLRPGTQIELPDHSSLRYMRLINDSRCAPDVQCVWAGDAAIELRWEPAEGSPQTFALHTGKPPREQLIGGLRLTLVSLARGTAPAARLRVEAAAAGQ
jgi:hypothetical protein